ncbi:MAG: hypothetical protein JWP12_368 [Bacteroidetes bacterium]|nr:hypothetical protein [Bacteroidota bacterium]
MSTENNIHDENDLNGMDPRFSKAGINNPFKPAGDYFESFADKMQSRVNAFEEIKTEAPLLNNIPKYNPFAVPSGYFDELPSLVQQRVIVERTKAPSLIEWLQLMIKPRFVIPVLTVALIAFAGIHNVNQDAVTEKATFAEEITVDDQLQLQNIDESTIVDALASQASATTTTTDNENQHIVDYLMENNVDETNLTSAL